MPDDVDVVASVSIRADGEPDQTEGYRVIGEAVEVAADVSRPKTRKSRSTGKETR